MSFFVAGAGGSDDDSDLGAVVSRGRRTPADARASISRKQQQKKKKKKKRKRRRFGSFDASGLADRGSALLGGGAASLPAPAPAPAPPPPRQAARPRSGSDFGSSSFDAGPFGVGDKRKVVRHHENDGASSSDNNDDDDIAHDISPRPSPSIPTATASTAAGAAADSSGRRPISFRATISPQHGDKRRALPVFACRAALVSALRRSPTIIVEGETGSGKTTQIPQYLLEEGWARSGRMIAVTQPRRVAAMSVAERVSEEVGCRLGGRVGYRVRFDDTTTGGVTQIKFMTDGMLLRESMVDPMLSKYSCIVLDEAHERTLHTDILFAVVKQIQERRNAKDGSGGSSVAIANKRKNSSSNSSARVVSAKLPSRRRLSLVVMSATLDTEMFSAYFNGAPVYSVPGRTFPVDIFYTTAPQSDYVAATLTSILQTHADAGRTEGDILVFLTGQEEIEDMARLLRDRRARLPNDCAVRDSQCPMLDLLPCPIYSAMPTEQQMLAFAKAPPYTRKVVLATNIAETSITIDGIRYVIDPGVVKQKDFVSATSSGTTGMETLHVVPISKAQAWQRAGRAGRQAPGRCFRLYTEESFMELKKSTIPEIQRCSLATVILQLKVLGVRDVMSFDFLQPPDTKAMVRALESLKMLGALKEDAGQRSRGGGRVASTDRPVKTTSSATFLKLTPLGRRMAELPLEPHFALALIRSCDDDISCSKEMLTVISMLSVENPFVSPANKREHAANAHRRFTAPSGDHLTLLNLYASFESECLAGGAGSRRGGDGGNAMMTKWLADNFINGRAMRRAVKIRKQLLERCSQLGMSIVSCQDRRAGVGRGGSTTSFMTSAEGDESVRRGLVAGLFLRTAEMLPGVHDDEDSMEVQDRKKGKRRTRGGAEYTRRKFKTMTEGIEVSVHPGSSLFSRRRQDAMGLAGRRRKHFVVFTELVLTKKAYMRGVSNIDGAWLRELAPQCFS